MLQLASKDALTCKFINSFCVDFGSYVVGVTVSLPVQVGQLLDFECTLKAGGVTVPENKIIMQK